MDRFGPSDDCEECGEPQQAGTLTWCEDCGKNLCKKCMSDHVCSLDDLEEDDDWEDWDDYDDTDEFDGPFIDDDLPKD